MFLKWIENLLSTEIPILQLPNFGNYFMLSSYSTIFANGYSTITISTRN